MVKGTALVSIVNQLLIILAIRRTYEKTVNCCLFAIGGIIFLSLSKENPEFPLAAMKSDSPYKDIKEETFLTDEVSEAKSAIRPISPKVGKAKTVQSILKASKLDSYKSQVLGGMKASFKGKKIDQKKWDQFAEAISNYPMEKEFEDFLKDYSQEELDYLLGHINHPAQDQIRKAQQENQQELIEVTKLTDDFKQDPKKEEYIEQIFEESKALESTMAISDAVTEPILMAMFKQKNPKANAQEMQAYAAKIIQARNKDTQRVMNNVLQWSFGKVDQPTLEDLSQYVRQYSDRGINDKYLADLKKFYRKYGRFIGKELTRLYQK